MSTEKSLMRLKAVDLKKRCADAGLDDSGTKADLVGRLLNQASNEDSSPPDAGDAPERVVATDADDCLLYTSPSPRDLSTSRMPSSA